MRDSEAAHLPGPRVQVDEQVLGFDVLEARSRNVVLELLRPLSDDPSRQRRGRQRLDE